MGCILAILWIPLLALGGFAGFTVGATAGGDIGALIGGLLGIFASHLIQWALWGDRRHYTVPPPWWNK
jgi:hypothetical protein